MVEDEQELTGGNASESVVRVGHTVRKPWLENSPVVQNYLGALRSSGVDVPEPLGRDTNGRHVVEYVEGELALDQSPLGPDSLLRAGRMIRQIHDASETAVISNPGDWKMLLPAENPNLMCHNDLAPWNLISEGCTVGDQDILVVLAAGRASTEPRSPQPADRPHVVLRHSVRGYLDDEFDQSLPRSNYRHGIDVASACPDQGCAQRHSGHGGVLGQRPAQPPR